jgi:GNAT superfamily N-acetyltransferase
MTAPLEQHDDITIRTGLRPGDLGWIIYRHGALYRQEYGWDESFEHYVARTMLEMVERQSPHDRVWIAARTKPDGDDMEIVGAIAIVRLSRAQGQLRWFYVEPSARGRALGRRLIDHALQFCRESGFESVILWTVDVLHDAARLYHAAGFRKVETRPGIRFGVSLIEEKYELDL